MSTNNKSQTCMILQRFMIRYSGITTMASLKHSLKICYANTRKNTVRMRTIPASSTNLPVPPLSKLYRIPKQTTFRPRNSKKEAPDTKDKLRISQTQIY